VCISSRADVTPRVVAALEQRVAEAGLQARVIVSGTGDWRYVDVTSARAGKLAALEYVRQLYGVSQHRCVAAGDSGNDTLMLGGRNLAIGGQTGRACGRAALPCLVCMQLEQAVQADAATGQPALFCQRWASSPPLPPPAQLLATLSPSSCSGCWSSRRRSGWW
jgi:hypothetical protein